MGLFDRVERRLDRVINGAFARAFKAEVQPVEIAAAMRKAMDDRAAVVAKGRTIVPNAFTIELDPNDHDRLTQYHDVLVDELIASVQEHVESQHYRPGGPLHVDFVVKDDLDTGVFRVRPRTSADVSGAPEARPRPRRVPERPAHQARNSPYPAEATAQPEGDVAVAGRAASAAAGAAAGIAAAGRAGGRHPQAAEPEAPPTVAVFEPPADPEPRAEAAQRPWLDVDGETYPLLGAITVLGRDQTADITLPDPGISRRHCEIRVTHDGPHLVLGLRDLGSTNGTYVNGEQVATARLHDGDRVTIGRVSFDVHVKGR